MATYPRLSSAGNCYHVFCRGAGRMILFEDDADNLYFLDCLDKYKPATIDILAWCLMGNHVHLLFRGDLDDISRYLQAVESQYARYYNLRTGHVGHVFQGRFGSQPISGDEQLRTVVRYIHENPVKAGLSVTCRYRWSSYDEYLGVPYIINPELVMAVFGCVDALQAFHGALTLSSQNENEKMGFLDDECGNALPSSGCPCSDEAALTLADEQLGAGWNHRIPECSKGERDSMIRVLRGAGLSVRQIERLTGIGRNIIQRVR